VSATESQVGPWKENDVEEVTKILRRQADVLLEALYALPADENEVVVIDCGTFDSTTEETKCH
jgi:hypothetical protein